MNTTTNQNIVTAAAVLLCVTAVTGCSVRSLGTGPPEKDGSTAIRAQIQDDPPRPADPDRQVPLRQLMEADRPESDPPTSSESTVPLRQLMEADRAEVAPPSAPKLRTVPLRQLIEADQ